MILHNGYAYRFERNLPDKVIAFFFVVHVRCVKVALPSLEKLLP